MRRLLWTFGLVAAGLWTLIILVGCYVLGSATDGVMTATGYVPGFPVEEFTLPWLAHMGRGVGLILLAGAWLFGSLLILAVPALGSLILKWTERRSSQLSARR